MIPNGIDLDRFDPGRYDRARCRQALGLAADDFVIGAVARLTPEKNLGHLLRAAKLLIDSTGVPARHRRRIQVVVAGPDQGCRAALEFEAAELEIADRVRFLGARSDVPEVLAALDVFTLTSIYEGSPFALLEAMAMGLPVVATHVGAVPEVVDGNGYLVGPLNPEQTCRALRELLLDDEPRARLGARSREVCATLRRQTDGQILRSDPARGACRIERGVRDCEGLVKILSVSEASAAPRRGSRKRFGAAIALGFMALACSLWFLTSAHADETTALVDNARSGWDPNEAGLSPARLKSGRFGKLFDTQIEGQAYAQPLVFRKEVIVATEANEVYGIDASSGLIRWQTKLGTPTPSDCYAASPLLGIHSTPVIDPKSGTLYILSRSLDGADPKYLLNALDALSGHLRDGWPVEIAGHAANDPAVRLDPVRVLQRPALLFLDGAVYAGFGGLLRRLSLPWLGCGHQCGNEGGDALDGRSEGSRKEPAGGNLGRRRARVTAQSSRDSLKF